MPFDEVLAARIRALIATQAMPDVTEKKMFGGLSFLVRGNMAIAASAEGGILVRADPDRSDDLIASTHARLAVMRGRPMSGWLRVDPEHLGTMAQLRKWVEIGTSFATSFPAKQ